MSINFITGGDLFDSGADMLINTTNIVGNSNKGIALSFKQRYPLYYEDYKYKCEQSLLSVDYLPLSPYYELYLSNRYGHYIWSFSTKKHWRNQSEYIYITNGLQRLYDFLSFNSFNIKTVAMPALGCGLGKLDWNIVSSMITYKLSKLTSINFIVYNPY